MFFVPPLWCKLSEVSEHSSTSFHALIHFGVHFQTLLKPLCPFGLSFGVPCSSLGGLLVPKVKTVKRNTILGGRTYLISRVVLFLLWKNERVDGDGFYDVFLQIFMVLGIA